MKHICSVCGNEINRNAVLQAIKDYPYEITEAEVDAYHLDCAISDGSWLKEEEVTPEMRQNGVYLMETNG